MAVGPTTAEKTGQQRVPRQHLTGFQRVPVENPFRYRSVAVGGFLEDGTSLLQGCSTRDLGWRRPSDPYAEIWAEIWDEELAKAFREHDWVQERPKILSNEEAGDGGRLEGIEGEFILPKDPNNIVLEPRIDIDSVVESNSYVLDEKDGEESIEWVNLISESDSG